MAFLFCDSFNHYVTADLLEKWGSKTETAGGTVTIHSAAGRRSGPGLRCTAATTGSGTTVALKPLAPADATCVAGFAFVTSIAPGTSGTAIFRVQDASGVQWTLILLSDLRLRVVRGGITGTTLATSTATLAANVSAYLECKVLISATVGTIEVRVNGVPVIGPLTGQNTQGSVTTGWTLAVPGLSLTGTTNPATQTLDYDDFYVLDGSGSAPWNTFLGDVRIDALMPTAAGATTGWTPSTGANWQAVDDAAPNDDTDYTFAASGLTDTFTVADAPVAGGIYGVQVCLSAKKTDAGTCTIAPVVRHAGADTVGTAQAPGTTYAYLLTPYATNPATGIAWTESTFNAAEFGYKRVS